MSDADFIIVGAGSAGAALAGRLSESPSTRVLLIEAGGSPSDEMFDIPSQWGRQFATRYDWDYSSEPEPGLAQRRTYLPRGKVLGGTSAMNGMLYVRGAPTDYDEWAQIGAPGWAWKDVLPYFIRSEANVRGASALHGDSGPLVISDRTSDNPLPEAWVQAAVDAGHKRNDDFNGPSQEGVGFYQLTVADGLRCSSYAAYLRDHLSRPNLTIRTFRRATRLLMEGDRVYGVEVEVDDRRETYTAEHEVILAAGAYNTPQILMLSGIGPRDELSRLGIDMVAELPVGRNLQDHPGVPLVMATDVQTLFTGATDEEWERYRGDGRGILASNAIEGGGFFRTLPELDDCDVQTVINPWPFMGDVRTLPTVNGFTVVVELLRPKSVGFVRLRSSEPSAKPLITHNHFAEQSDFAPLVRGIRRQFEILASSPIREMQTGYLRWPDATSDDALEAYVRHNGLGFFHPSSTCAIGSVLEPDLKVFGVDGLRVADASSMPTTIRGNPNAACIMIGERAADFITEAYGLDRTRLVETVEAGG